MKYFIWFIFLFSGFVFSCNQKKQSNENTGHSSSIESALPAITFLEKEFEFGDIQQGDIVKHVFKFKNTGSTYLKIQSVSASCGCTTPQWPKEAIAPQAEGEIYVEFNSQGKMGMQTKTISITANTDPAMTQLTIKVNVLTKK